MEGRGKKPKKKEKPAQKMDKEKAERPSSNRVGTALLVSTTEARLHLLHVGQQAAKIVRVASVDSNRNFGGWVSFVVRHFVGSVVGAMPPERGGRSGMLLYFFDTLVIISLVSSVHCENKNCAVLPTHEDILCDGVKAAATPQQEYCCGGSTSTVRYCSSAPAPQVCS